ncbi:MAG: hypothetical protein RIR26_212 [Pseudomonadota bacterium]
MFFNKKMMIFSTFLILTIPIVFGFLVWLATARPADFYFIRAARENAAGGVWFEPSALSKHGGPFQLQRADLSLWFEPEKLNKALVHFDSWMQEFALIREITHEAVEDQNYELPPAVVPHPGQAMAPLEDAYDLALRNLMEDIWSSGAVSLAGSLHFRVPHWQKFLSGWLTANVPSNRTTAFFDSTLEQSGLRDDAADLLSWFSRLPYAHLSQSSQSGLVWHESVFDVSGAQLADLHSHLCDLENLPESYCESNDSDESFLDPLLFATEDFKFQFVVFWAVRGDHLLWSNRKECLLSLVADEQSDGVGCGRAPQQGIAIHKRESFLSHVRRDKGPREGSRAGFYLNQSQLTQGFGQSVKKLLSIEGIQGASWLQDAMRSVSGERTVREWDARLRSAEVLKPLWGARLSLPTVQEGRLAVFLVQGHLPPEEDNSTSHSEDQFFSLLYGLNNAWFGLPRGPGRVLEVRRGKGGDAIWKTDAVYRLGWSERE